MKKLVLCILAATSIATMNFVNADVSAKSDSATQNSSVKVSSDFSSNCYMPSNDAIKNMNASLEKMGYGHPASVSVRPAYQILVPDKANKQQTLFFDFDPATGNMIGKGTAQ